LIPKHKENDNVSDGEDTKPAAKGGAEEPDVHPAASSEDDTGVINGETVLGFDRFPTSSNKTIMLEHYDFVRWARERTHPVYGRLEDFVAWSNTDEAKALEIQGMGKEHLRLVSIPVEHLLRF